MTCPVCQQSFTPIGRQKYCSNACRAAAYRRRRDDRPPIPPLPKAQPRRPVTVYECPKCGTRQLGTQRCEDCATFTTRIGHGGICPNCEHPVTFEELAETVSNAKPST